jgi:hypothetical protein
MPPTRSAPAVPHDPAAAPPAPRTPRTLPLAREAFLAAARRDTPGTDLPRYAAVLDALLAWSATRPGRLTFRTEPTAAADLRFGPANGAGVLWAARPTRGGAPTLEIAPGGASLSGEARARAVATLNAHSRAVLAPGDRLRIGFGALKNAAALAAVLALLDDLLGPPDGAPTAGAAAAPPARAS